MVGVVVVVVVVAVVVVVVVVVLVVVGVVVMVVVVVAMLVATETPFWGPGTKTILMFMCLRIYFGNMKFDLLITINLLTRKVPNQFAIINTSFKRWLG